MQQLAWRYKVSAAAILGRLGAHKSGGAWMARCPAHDDKTPSLSIREGNDGIVLVRCHAGCSQERVVASLRELGLWEKTQFGNNRTVPKPIRVPQLEPDPEIAKRTRAALTVWNQTLPAQGTLVESYLSARGLTDPIPSLIRYHPGLRHRHGGKWPAMVALVKDGKSGLPMGIHRTFLSRDGTGKAAVEPQKMMLGPCRGGAVQLVAAEEVLMVGEGLETCLSAMQVMHIPAWAALSTSGLRTLDLPTTVREIVVLADGDDPGEEAARHCAQRWSREARRVRIVRPPRGLDFNDLLTGHEVAQ